jgi:hypothetical protein
MVMISPYKEPPSWQHAILWSLELIPKVLAGMLLRRISADVFQLVDAPETADNATLCASSL